MPGPGSRLARLGRILLILCVALVALPFVYAFGVYALVFGGYALFGAAGLALAVLEGGWPTSLGDLGGLATFGFSIGLVLFLCAGTLFLIWKGFGLFRAWAFRGTRLAAPVPAPRPVGGRRRVTGWGIALLVLVGLGALALALPEAPDDRPKTHVTVYLDPAVVESGGLLVVAGVPVTEERWRAALSGDNLAMLDPANPKAAEVAPGDRHFGARVESAVAAVEFPYPEAGTYTFNILPAPGTEAALGEQLATEGVGNGSADLMPDPETGGDMSWPSMNLVAVLGPGRDAAWARGAFDALADALREGVAVRRTEGVRTLSLSAEQVERLVDGSHDPAGE